MDYVINSGRVFDEIILNQESPWQTNPKKGQFTNFSQGQTGTRVRDVSFVLVFPRKNTRVHKNGRNSWTFLFWPFFWFGLPGRLLIEMFTQNKSLTIFWCNYCKINVWFGPVERCKNSHNLCKITWPEFPEDRAVLKILRRSKFTTRSKFTIA